MEKQKQAKEQKKPKITEVVSAVLPDGTLIETVVDPATSNTGLIVHNKKATKIVDRYKLSDMEVLVPIPATNALLKNKLVCFAEKPADYGSLDELVSGIRSFIHRYVDLAPEFETACACYVLLTWVYDRFNELPYLRKVGEYGSGKTRFLKVLGAICYKPIFVSGGASEASLFHIANQFQGTLVVDEADFRFSDEQSAIAKILNNGNSKGFPILRVQPDQHGRYSVISYDVFCPKIIASRNHYQDQALESRFITESFRPHTKRQDIPTTLPASFEAHALQLRNRLLEFRLKNHAQTKPLPIEQTYKLEGRIRQIFAPLLSLVENQADKETLLSMAENLSQEIESDRENTVEAHVLASIEKLREEGKTLTVGAITAQFIEDYSDYYDRKISAKWIGYIIRKRLNLQTQKSNGNYQVLTNPEK